MAVLPQSRLQSLLQAAVQTVQWTYSLFWQLNPQQRVLVWCDGYYNGAIKTRKTVQATEESAEEVTLQRSQQLRELYESLSAGDTSQQARRPSASLSPEDLTESEWFYLMCVSFSFPLGVGLPGKAYVERQHIWLTGASEADSKLFSRTILAKSAKIQTVVCIPLLDGIVELGTTERVEEDNGVIQCVKSFFTESQNPNHPQPALSEHSTSNLPTSSYPGLYSPEFAPPQAAEEVEEDADETGSDSDQEDAPTQPCIAAEPMQLEMSDQDIRVGSPDYSEDNLDSDFHLLAVSPLENCSGHRGLDGGTVRSWPVKDPVICTTLQPPHSVGVAEEDTHYSQTVSSILENQSNRWSKLSSSSATWTATSAFTKWLATPTTFSSHQHNLLLDGAAQWVLKYILFTVPLLHTKPRDAAARRGTTPQEELNGNHVLAERRRREKLNERFIILRSMVPFVTKMDKASILADTIEYLNQLKKRIQELESTARRMEADKERRGEPTARRKRKIRMIEDVCGGGGGGSSKAAESPAQVEVSIIESDALVEIQCLHKGGLLLEVMQILGGLGIQVTTVQSSINGGTFIAELRAKVKENGNGRKPSIMEVKRTIKQIIQH